MTILGFHIISAARAFAWCDTEIYGEDAVSGHTLKMEVNALALAVGMGSGTLGGARAAGRRLQDCLTFDEALGRVPEAMRGNASLPHGSLEARAPIREIYAVAGYSHRLGRLIGAVFNGTSEIFAWPHLAQSFLSPSLDDPAGAWPTSLDEVIATAQLQFAHFKRQTRYAEGGALIVAEISPSGVVARPVFDLWNGRLMRAPLILSATEARRPPSNASQGTPLAHSEVAEVTPNAGGLITPLEARPDSPVAALARRDGAAGITPSDRGGAI